MTDDRYRNLPFAPWATDVGWQQEQAAKLALLAEMVANCQDRPPTDEEREAIAWFAGRGGKLPGYCRQLTAALALPFAEQREFEAGAALGRIRRELGLGLT